MMRLIKVSDKKYINIKKITSIEVKDSVYPPSNRGIWIEAKNSYQIKKIILQPYSSFRREFAPLEYLESDFSPQWNDYKEYETTRLMKIYDQLVEAMLNDNMQIIKPERYSGMPPWNLDMYVGKEDATS